MSVIKNPEPPYIPLPLPAVCHVTTPEPLVFNIWLIPPLVQGREYEVSPPPTVSLAGLRSNPVVADEESVTVKLILGLTNISVLYAVALISIVASSPMVEDIELLVMVDVPVDSNSEVFSIRVLANPSPVLDFVFIEVTAVPAELLTPNWALDSSKMLEELLTSKVA